MDELRPGAMELFGRIEKVVYSTSLEWDMSLAEGVGVLDMVKIHIIDRALKKIDEGEEGDVT